MEYTKNLKKNIYIKIIIMFQDKSKIKNKKYY